MRIKKAGIDERREPWEAQLRKGCLEMAILASLWKNKLYGLEILRTLEAGSRLGLAEGTLYLILNRLKHDELVDSEWVDAGTGHPRKYYWLTVSGKDRLREMAQFWNQFARDLDALLSPIAGGKKKEEISANR